MVAWQGHGIARGAIFLGRVSRHLHLRGPDSLDKQISASTKVQIEHGHCNSFAAKTLREDLASTITILYRNPTLISFKFTLNVTAARASPSL